MNDNAEIEDQKDEIRYLGDVQRLVLSDGDRIVLSVQRSLSNMEYARIKEIVERELPGHRVLLLEDGMKIGILSAQQRRAAELPSSAEAGAQADDSQNSKSAIG